MVSRYLYIPGVVAAPPSLARECYGCRDQRQVLEASGSCLARRSRTSTLLLLLLPLLLAAAAAGTVAGNLTMRGC